MNDIYLDDEDQRSTGSHDLRTFGERRLQKTHSRRHESECVEDSVTAGTTIKPWGSPVKHPI